MDLASPAVSGTSVYANGLIKYEKNNGYLMCRPATFMTITHLGLLKMRNISNNIVEKIKTHFVFSNFITKIVPFMKLYGKNTVQPDITI